MQRDDAQLGRPAILWLGTTAEIEAVATPIQGMYAFSTDELCVYAYDGSDWIKVGAGAGTGDVVGPAGATDGNMAVFDGGTGKLLKDGGAPGGGGGDFLVMQVFS